jgi:hypothetical protein
VLFVGAIGILHFAKHFAWQFFAVAATPVSFAVNRAIEKGTGFVRHHFFCPESLSFNSYAAVTFLAVKFTFVAD